MNLSSVQSHSLLPNDVYTKPTPPLFSAVFPLVSFHRNTLHPHNYTISPLSSNSSYCPWHTTAVLQSTFTTTTAALLLLRLRRLFVFPTIHFVLLPVFTGRTFRHAEDADVNSSEQHKEMLVPLFSHTVEGYGDKHDRSVIIIHFRSLRSICV